jgi:hypothetical protein
MISYHVVSKISLLLAKRICDLWIKTLFVKSIPIKRIAIYLLWKYRPGHAYIAFAKNKNKIVATCVGVDLICRSGTIKLHGCWGMDALTDRNSHEIDIFTFSRVYKRIVTDGLKERIDIFLTFPSKMSASTYLNAGWIDLKNTFLYEKKIGYEHMAGSFKLQNNYNLKKIKYFDDKINDFFEKIAPKFAFIGERSKKFLNWRYVWCPIKKYDLYIIETDNCIAGYLVLRVGSGKGAIVDILVDPDHKELLDFSIDKATKILRTQNVESISCLASDRRLINSLLYSGFNKKLKIDLYAKYKNSDDKKFKKILTKKNAWFFTIGDGDFEMED